MHCLQISNITVVLKGRRLASLKGAGSNAKCGSSNLEEVDVRGTEQLVVPDTEHTQVEAIPIIPVFGPEAVSDASSIFVTKDNGEASSLTPMTTSPSSQATPFSTSSAADDCLISHSNNTVFTALFKNGRVLGLPCGTQICWKSPPRGLDIPAPLQSTPLQMTTLHTSWIDRFPFPHLRDNFIRLNGVINEEDFLQTLFETHSFTIVPGTMSWDPNGWIIGKEFGEKWGYLFY